MVGVHTVGGCVEGTNGPSSLLSTPMGSLIAYP